METIEEQSPTHPFKEDIDAQAARTEIDHQHSCHPQTDSSQVIVPAIFPSECSGVIVGEFTSTISVGDSEVSTTMCPRASPLSRTRTTSLVIDQRDEREEDLNECLNRERETGTANITDEEGTRESYDYSRGDFPSSLPPSSSPPQFLSSSPDASSQSSVSGTEPPKMAIETGNCPDWPHSGDMVSVLQEEFDLEPEDSPSSATADATTSSEAGVHLLRVSPVPHNDDGFVCPRKRIACQSDSEQPSPSKYPKPDPCLYLPPAPKRATLVSHHRQFKKLAAPFRPPSKLPVVPAGPARTVNNREAESAATATPQSDYDKIDAKPSNARLLLRNKASNTLGSVTQFKSPLLNKAHPTDSRTIRLTPALQTLERKLQLLKRAVKVKEDGEEELLVRLAGKWIEAGREVAYDVWDATKDASDLEGTHKSYGWESSDNGNTSWGWDTKPGDGNEELRDLDSSVAAVRSVLEEDEEVCHNTLGTMLCRLGVAPEILGWNDDKEIFSD